MGWCSGSSLADELWDTVKDSIPKKKQKAIAKKWVDIFEGEDCDTMEESQLYDLAGLRREEEDEE